MRSRSHFQKAKTLLLIVGLSGGLTPLVWADVFEYTEDFGKFGRQQNNVCGGGVCGAIAAINSFAFLQNTHAGLYGMNLLPNYQPDGTDPIDAAAFATGGWGEPVFAHADDTPTADSDKGYYARTGNANQDYLDAKKDWFSDHVPGSDTTFAMFLNPTVAQLANQILDQEDVEFFVNNARKHI